MSTYTLRLATEATRDLVVEALRAEAGKRTRVAVKASLSVAADRLERKDVRSASVRVTALLAEAAQLGALADELAAAEAMPVLTMHPSASAMVEDLKGLDLEDAAVILGVPLDAPDPDEDTVDDGLSDAAHAAMAAAEEFAEEYLADPDGTDVDTHALGEDEPDTDDVVEVLP